MSCYCHITPGRLRVKTPIIRQNAGEAERVCELLRALPGVQSVSVNAMTGSVTIHHDDTAADSESILSVLKESGHYGTSQERNHSMESITSRIGETLGKVLLGAVVEKAFEGSLLSFLAFLV